YIKKWPWFLAFSLAGVLLGFLYFKYSQVTYEISSRILVKSDDRALNDLLSFNSPGMNRDLGLNIESQIGILKSYTLFHEAFENLNWETSWYKKELLYKKELYKSKVFHLDVPPNGMNLKNIPVEITVLDKKKYLLKASGETFLNGYHQVLDIEETLNFG